MRRTRGSAATQEMRARFAARFGGKLAARLEFRTINGVAARIIALYSRMYGRTPPELIRNESETTPLLMRLWQDTNHEYPAESTVKDLRTAITYIKNMCMTDAELDELETDIENLPDLYRGYQKALKAAHKMDYDDQLCFALQILRGAPAVAAAFRKRYKYFCVDESQDTSKVQHEIIRVLAQESGNIFMVGDEDQSIYGFRAAYPQALMDFEKTYPGAQILLMEQNYRSTEPILEAANRFVARNRYRRPKTIAPTQGPGAPLQIVTVPRRADQLPFLFETAQHCDTGTAVLFRNHESALPIIDLCERRGIPYACKAVDQTFFTNKIVRDVTDIFTLAAHPADGETFLRCYYKFGVPVTRAQALFACNQARQYGQGCWTALLNEDSIRPRTRVAMADVADGLARLPKMAADDAVRFLADQLGYGKYLDKSGMDRTKLAVLEMLGAQEPTPRHLLRRLEKLRSIIQNHENPPGCRFLLSTIHSAKGLEFPYVFLIGMEEGVFPSEMSKYSEADLEEERRLAYVGITRAKKELYISNSVSRMLYGRTQRNEPSRFLREIEPEYIEETRSPVLEQRSRFGGWGDSYRDTVPGGASGYSGPSGWGRSASGYGTGGYGSGYSNRSGYLNREYNAGEGRGFGSAYANRGQSQSGYGSGYGRSGAGTGYGSGYSSAYSDGTTQKKSEKQISFTGTPAAKTAAKGAKHYEPGDLVEHKVFGRGQVVAVKPAAGDQIVEINFEKVGIKKTMANFAPLTKITAEE